MSRDITAGMWKALPGDMEGIARAKSNAYSSSTKVLILLIEGDTFRYARFYAGRDRYV
jgi:hypothetical protein